MADNRIPGFFATRRPTRVPGERTVPEYAAGHARLGMGLWAGREYRIPVEVAGRTALVVSDRGGDRGCRVELASGLVVADRLTRHGAGRFALHVAAGGRWAGGRFAYDQAQAADLLRGMDPHAEYFGLLWGVA